MIKKIISALVIGATLSAPMTAIVTTNEVREVSAATYSYVEDHSTIDCTNRYTGDWPGYVYGYIFTIKIPKGQLNKVMLAETDIFGGAYTKVNLADVRSNDLKYLYSDSQSDYYNYVSGYYPGSGKYKCYGVGVKLYYDKGNVHKMATDTSNGSVVEGKGYYLVGR